METISVSYLTIKELTEAVGGHVTPRMVRHYHAIGLLPAPERSTGNYRLYTEQDVHRLNRIVALKQQGFQLSHIRQLLATNAEAIASETLLIQLQQQYGAVMQQLNQLRQTATALESLIGHDRECQTHRTAAIAQLQQLKLEANDMSALETLWEQLDAATIGHPESFEESLQRLMPDLSDRSEIEVDLLSKLVLACGDVSLIPFVQLSRGAIAAARNALKAGCPVVVDVPAIATALDQTRLAHLGCITQTLLPNPHITSASEAEQAFWQQEDWTNQLAQIPDGAIFVIGYVPSVLMAVCDRIEQQRLHPALIIGLPIGFSHAPAAKRRLRRSSIPSLTIQGAMGGGLLAAVALNAFADSLIEKPNCHCYLNA
jgi:precorrin-8X/cobalt-precorrin-8 methylmutase